MTDTDILVIVWLVAMAIVAGTLLGVAVVAIFKSIRKLYAKSREWWSIDDDI